jgi:hypothetical protein
VPHLQTLAKKVAHLYQLKAIELTLALRVQLEQKPVTLIHLMISEKETPSDFLQTLLF